MWITKKLLALVKYTIIKPMTQEDLLFKMWNEKDNFIPPLQTKEILDFCDTKIIDEPRLWFPEWKKDLTKPFKQTVDKSKITIYKTKKSLRQDIKLLNDKLDWWLSYKKTAPNEITKVYCDLHLEDYQLKKENLSKKLRYVGVKFSNDKLMMARQVPISDFLEFDRYGMAKCPFHSERTASFHKIPKKEKGYCFGGCGTKDVVDVVMVQNNCTLPEALKIILKK